MFYELEDVRYSKIFRNIPTVIQLYFQIFRSHLREIKDRSVLRLFESNEVAAAPQILSGNPGIPQHLPQQIGPWDQDPVN